MIKFKNVTKEYFDGTTALKEASFEIDKGEFVFLVGPSGAGKTTILKLLLKEIKPTSGKIEVDGENIVKLKTSQVPYLRRKIGAVFQDFKLLYDWTVYENVSIALEMQGKKSKDIKDEVNKALELVGLEKKSKLFPIQLSGGELQRISLARAMVVKPKVLFADEPTGNLDMDTGWQIINLLKQINKKGTTVIMATHNIEIVDSLNQRVIRLKKGKIKSDKKKGKYQQNGS